MSCALNNKDVANTAYANQKSSCQSFYIQFKKIYKYRYRYTFFIHKMTQKLNWTVRCFFSSLSRKKERKTSGNTIALKMTMFKNSYPLDSEGNNIPQCWVFSFHTLEKQKRIHVSMTADTSSSNDVFFSHLCCFFVAWTEIPVTGQPKSNQWSESSAR